MGAQDNFEAIFKAAAKQRRLKREHEEEFPARCLGQGRKSMENPPDLTVTIPERFRSDLEHRFDAGNAVHDGCSYAIKVWCPLCKEFPESCTYCPFYRFRKEDKEGCLEWTKRVLGDEEQAFSLMCHGVWWHEQGDVDARRQLALLRKRAGKLIRWEEEEERQP